MTMLDTEIFSVAQGFARELQKLHARMDWPSYRDHRLALVVTHTRDKTKYEITWSQGYGEPIKATDLGIVMDEVYRRLGFTDHQQALIEQSLQGIEYHPDEEPI